MAHDRNQWLAIVNKETIFPSVIKVRHRCSKRVAFSSQAGVCCVELAYEFFFAVRAAVQFCEAC
jgi:hypothetical protein